MVLRRLAVKHKTLNLSAELMRYIGPVKRLKAAVLIVSPSLKRIKELWVALGLHGEWGSYAIGRNMAT